MLLYEWLVYKVPVTDIYLPASSWSDEVVYSKQLSAVVEYGAPQGYFGFNESHADIGTFAAWGPAIFWLYAIPGFFLRGQNAFLWCNLFFVAAGWLVFARAARLKAWQQAAFAVVLACLNAPAALCLLRHAGAAALRPWCWPSPARRCWCAAPAATGLGSFVHPLRRSHPWPGPINAVYWLYPLVLAWPAGGLCCAAVRGRWPSHWRRRWCAMAKFYAPYFFTNVDTAPLQMLAHLQVLLRQSATTADKLGTAFTQVGQEIAGALRGEGGGYYLIFLLLLAVTLVYLAWGLAPQAAVLLEGLCRSGRAGDLFRAVADVPHGGGLPPHAGAGHSAAGGAGAGKSASCPGHGGGDAGADGGGHPGADRFGRVRHARLA